MSRVAPTTCFKGLTGAGVPPFMANALVEFDVAASQGYHAIVAPTVKEFGGSEPTSVREFLTANKAAFAAELTAAPSNSSPTSRGS